MVMEGATELFGGAPEAPEAEVAVATLGWDPTPAEPTEPTEPTEKAEAPEEPPSPEDRIQQLEEELRKTQTRLSTAEGRVRAVGVEQFEALQSTVQRMDREHRRMVIEADEGLTEPQRQSSLADLDVQTAQDQEGQAFQKYAGRIQERILKRAARLDISPAVKQEINARWSRATTQDAVDDVYDFVDDLVEEQTAVALKEAKKPPAGQAAKDLTMGTVPNRTAASGEPEQELVNRLGRGEVLSPAEMITANKAMTDKGLLPIVKIKE